MPGSTNGATTPVHSTQQTFKESFTGNGPGIVNKKTRQDDTKEKAVDFVASLDPDYDGGTLPRRKSRRVSSMLARSDLSATHERSAFFDLASGHTNATARRTESLGGLHGRNSIGSHVGMNGQTFIQAPAFNQSLNSFLEAPVDELLDELRAGGDFEGFHNMGLDDEEFDSLRQEIVLTKVCVVPAEHSNVRYSSQHLPASTQSKVFTLTAPPSAADEQKGNSVVICILDADEKKLLVLTLYTKTHKADINLNGDHAAESDSEKDLTVVSLGSIMRANGVIDACRLDDGQVSRILVLTETPDGYGELSLQAPWSVLMKVPLPAKFAISNVRNLGHDATPRAKREGGFKRVLSQGPRSLNGLRNSKPQGVVDLIDDSGKMHQLQILLEARNPHVRNILEVCRSVVPGGAGGEGVLVGWWSVMQWFRLESIEVVDVEWSALVITLFSMVLGVNKTVKPTQKPTHTKRKSRAGHLRSSSGAQSDLEDWEIMFKQETSNGNPLPSWAESSAWKWLEEENDLIPRSKNKDSASLFTSQVRDNTSFLRAHVKLAKDFANTHFGYEAISGCLPSCGDRPFEARVSALADIFIGLHLLHEEEKLNTMASDSFVSGVSTLTPILAQMATWLGWKNWIEAYEVEEASLIDVVYETGNAIAHSNKLS